MLYCCTVPITQLPTRVAWGSKREVSKKDTYLIFLIPDTYDLYSSMIRDVVIDTNPSIPSPVIQSSGLYKSIQYCFKVISLSAVQEGHITLQK